MPQQRIRLTYRVDGPAVDAQRGWVSQTWVEAFATAGMPLARPEGSRRPRIALGPGIPPGAIGERELLDVWLAEPVDPGTVVARLIPALPPGLTPLDAEDVPERLPSLSATIRAARYRAAFESAAIDIEKLRGNMAAFLAAPSIEWVEQRGDRLRALDLRAVVFALTLACTEPPTLEMHLELTPERTGRPASVLAALGVTAKPAALVRAALDVTRPRVALRAWRERGRFE